MIAASPQSSNNTAEVHKSIMLIPTIPLLEVQARWAYSEIVDGTLAHSYDPLPNANELRSKRRAGISFDQLTPTEQYNLAFLCVAARPGCASEKPVQRAN